MSGLSVCGRNTPLGDVTCFDFLLHCKLGRSRDMVSAVPVQVSRHMISSAWYQQWIRAHPSWSGLCPLGMKDKPPASGLPLLPAEICSKVFLGLGDLCGTLSNFEIMLTVSKNSTAICHRMVFPNAKIDVQLLQRFSEQMRLRRAAKSSAQVKHFK